MPADLDHVWERLVRVEEKLDAVIALLRYRKRRRKRAIGFEVIPGGGIMQDPPVDEGE